MFLASIGQNRTRNNVESHHRHGRGVSLARFFCPSVHHPRVRGYLLFRPQMIRIFLYFFFSHLLLLLLFATSFWRANYVVGKLCLGLSASLCPLGWTAGRKRHFANWGIQKSQSPPKNWMDSWTAFSPFTTFPTLSVFLSSVVNQVVVI